MTSPTDGVAILVVDDDLPTQHLLRAVLRRRGYLVEVAADGREAIAMIEAGTYAAVVLDVMMPTLSGYEVVAFLAHAAKNIPVVICSAAGPKALADFPHVVKAVVRKPFDIDQLLQAVSAAIEARA